MSQIFAEIGKGKKLALPHFPPYLRPSATSADHLPIPSALPILLQIALVGEPEDLARAGDVAGLVRLGGADDVKDVEVDAVRLHGQAARLGQVMAADPAVARRVPAPK